MDRPISRRDLLHGMGLLAAGACAPGLALAESDAALDVGAGNYYPPALTGLRGNHTGSYEVAHALAREGRSNWGEPEKTDDRYDVVVVGGGLSGLAAAYFFREEHPDARILILDNHDDFGGHAKRNEFSAYGRQLLCYGGSQTLEYVSEYSDTVLGLLRQLKVDPHRFDTAFFDRNFYKRNGLAGGLFFDREHWGRDQIVPFELGNGAYLNVAESPLSAAEAVRKMPLSAAARQQLLGLLTGSGDRMKPLSDQEKRHVLARISYREFLERYAQISEPDVFRLFQNLTTDSAAGIEAVPADVAFGYFDLPGYAMTGLDFEDDEEPYIHHFPDGNASIARLLVRQLVPSAAPGDDMEDILLAPFDYAALDRRDSQVRVRLNSTAVRVSHEGAPGAARTVHVDYVRQGRTYRVSAGGCILACYNCIIPYLCPELPEQQRQALAFQVKAPILYTNIAVRDWTAWYKLGLGHLTAPDGYHTVSMLDFPVSMGGYEYSPSPDFPVMVHMERFPHRNNEGLSTREQCRLGRYELLATSFEDIERNVRAQLGAMLSSAGFDPARDIAAITCNRWAHGYAYSYNPLFDPIYENWDDPRYPHMKARQQFGRITIANSDAGADAELYAAVDQGYRAALELG